MLTTETKLSNLQLSTTDFAIFSKLLEDKTVLNLDVLLKNYKTAKDDLIEDAISLGLLKKHDFNLFLEKNFNIKFASFEEVLLSEKLNKNLPQAILLKDLFFPFFESETQIYCLVREFYSQRKAVEIQRLLATEKEIILFFELTNAIKDAILRHFHSSQSFEKTLESLQNKGLYGVRSETITVKDPIILFTEGLLEEAFFQKIDKIYFDIKEKLIEMVFEKNGVKHYISYIEKENWIRVLNRIKVMFGLKVAENFSIQASSLSLKIGSKETLFKLAVYPSFFGENVSISLLYKTEVMALEELGFSKNNFQKIIKNLEKNEGITVVTGDKKSAKTLIYAMGEHLLKSNKVCLIEREITNNIHNFTEVRGLENALASGIKTLLFTFETAEIFNIWDKKIICYGNVFDIISTKKVLKEIEVSSILHQKALKKLCSCKLEIELKTDDLQQLRLAKTDVKKIYTKNGCALCQNTGYLGEIIALEILQFDSEVEEIFEENATKKSILEALKRRNFSSIFEDARLKVLQGLTDISELKKVIGL